MYLCELMSWFTIQRVSKNYFLSCSETVQHTKSFVTGWQPILMQHLWVGGCSQNRAL